MALSSTFVAASGDGYEVQMGRWSRRLAELFLDFCGPCDGQSILDAGCGTGALSAAILKRTKSAEVSGIDFSEAYIEHAKRTVIDPRAEFRVGRHLRVAPRQCLVRSRAVVAGAAIRA